MKSNFVPDDRSLVEDKSSFLHIDKSYLIVFSSDKTFSLRLLRLRLVWIDLLIMKISFERIDSSSNVDEEENRSIFIDLMKRDQREA